jgi:AraC family transcriptional regulator
MAGINCSVDSYAGMGKCGVSYPPNLPPTGGRTPGALFTAASALQAISLGPTQVLASSLGRAWRGIVVEKHAYAPGDRRAVGIDQHIVSLWNGGTARLEIRGENGKFVSSSPRVGAVMVTPAGAAPEARLHSSAVLLHCAMDKGLVRGIGEELGLRGGESEPDERQFHSGVEDGGIAALLSLLANELETASGMSTLYVDSLVCALVTRYLRLPVKAKRERGIGSQALLPHILKRVREKMEANPGADLTLESLAAESGYSRGHFLRMFRAATGATPHQYVLDLRLELAQRRLKEPGSHIADVAVECGFSSQSHMTNLFRRRFQLTPATYRRG